MESKLFYENLFSCTFNFYDNFDPPVEHNDWWTLLLILTIPILLILLFIDGILNTNYFINLMNFIIGRNSIPAFSVGNYAHAQYMHWIEDSKCYCKDCELYSRYNIPENI